MKWIFFYNKINSSCLFHKSEVITHRFLLLLFWNTGESWIWTSCPVHKHRTRAFLSPTYSPVAVRKAIDMKNRRVSFTCVWNDSESLFLVRQVSEYANTWMYHCVTVHVYSYTLVAAKRFVCMRSSDEKCANDLIRLIIKVSSGMRDRQQNTE